MLNHVYIEIRKTKSQKTIKNVTLTIYLPKSINRGCSFAKLFFNQLKNSLLNLFNSDTILSRVFNFYMSLENLDKYLRIKLKSLNFSFISPFFLHRPLMHTLFYCNAFCNDIVTEKSEGKKVSKFYCLEHTSQESSWIKDKSNIGIMVICIVFNIVKGK